MVTAAIDTCMDLSSIFEQNKLLDGLDLGNRVNKMIKDDSYSLVFYQDREKLKGNKLVKK